MEIKRCYETIIGASVGENQLVQSGATSVTVPNGHKYYSKINGTETLGASTGTAITINDSAKDMVIDLTQMLGSAIADYVYGLGTSSGIAKLRSWGFLRGYQAFNAGSLESVEVTGKKVVGFNQWDEVWEVGGISSVNGGNASADDTIRSTNYIPVIPNKTYYAKSTTGVWIWGYDANKNYVEKVPSSSRVINTSFTIPSNIYYLRFVVPSDYGTTYNHDICVNLSSDRNGEYEAYTSQTYALGDDKLRGLFKLDANNNLYADGDRKTSDGLIARKYMLIDLGSLNWTVTSSSETRKVFGSGVISDIKAISATNVVPDLITPKFVATTIGATWVAGQISMTSTGLQAVSCITNPTEYADANAFKTAMSGQYLVYPLASEVIERSTPFPSPQVCYPDGTEEFITESGVPVGHETKYEL